jgi:hypothetical protein
MFLRIEFGGHVYCPSSVLRKGHGKEIVLCDFEAGLVTAGGISVMVLSLLMMRQARIP